MDGQTRKFKLTENVLFEILADEAVLLNLNDSHYYGLDDVAMRIWQLLVTQGDTETVVAQMLKEYAVDEATIRRDLTVLVEEMERRGLITRVEA
jgi:hypothetical protein